MPPRRFREEDYGTRAGFDYQEELDNARQLVIGFGGHMGPMVGPFVNRRERHQQAVPPGRQKVRMSEPDINEEGGELMPASRVVGKRIKSEDFPVVVAMNEAAAERLSMILFYCDEIGFDIALKAGFSGVQLVRELNGLREAIRAANVRPKRRKS